MRASTPRPGTKLESVAKEVKPFSVDPAVATTSTSGRFIVGGNSLGPFWRGVLATYRDRLAADKQKGAAVALAYYDAVLAAMAGQQSTSMSLYKEAPYLSGAFAFPLKDAASAAQGRRVAGGAGQRGGFGAAARAARRHVVGRVDGQEGGGRQAEDAALPGEDEEEVRRRAAATSDLRSASWGRRWTSTGRSPTRGC